MITIIYISIKIFYSQRWTTLHLSYHNRLVDKMYSSYLTVVLLRLFSFRQLIVAFNAFLDGFARLADVAAHSKGKMFILLLPANRKLLSDQRQQIPGFNTRIISYILTIVLTIYINCSKFNTHIISYILTIVLIIYINCM